VKTNIKETFLSIIVRPISRLIDRFFLWRKFISSFHGTTFLAELNIFFSALFDILLCFVSGWAYNPKMLLSGTYLIKLYGILIYARGGTEDLYYALPNREGDVHDFILNKLKQGDIFVDVGANVGYYTILASKLVGVNGKVFAIEPVPQTLKVLRFNIKLNGLKNVIVVDKAGWHTRTKLKLKIPMNEFGLSSSFRSGGLEVNVDAIPLDEVLNCTNRLEIKLIKLDVEGAEYEVLKGSIETLKHTKFVILELSRRTEACLRLLQAYGFKCKKMKFTNYYACARVK
jgi:FkbM family methyltransferase